MRGRWRGDRYQDRRHRGDECHCAGRAERASPSAMAAHHWLCFGSHALLLLLVTPVVARLTVAATDRQSSAVLRNRLPKGAPSDGLWTTFCSTPPAPGWPLWRRATGGIAAAHNR